MIYFEINKNTREIMSGPWGSNELPEFSEDSNFFAVEASNFKVGWFLEEDGSLTRPNAPYPSWVWNDTLEAWESPVPYPSTEEGVWYAWNEGTTSWVE